MEIFLAIAEQNLAAVQALIKANPNVVNMPSPPGDSTLLKLPAQPLLPGITPLMAAAQYCTGHSEAKDDDKTKTNRIEVAKQIIATLLGAMQVVKANLNEIDVYHSRTALHWAVVLRNPLFLDELLATQAAKEHGELYFHKQDASGLTAAEIAKQNGFNHGLEAINKYRLLNAGKGPVSMAIVGMGATGSALFIRLVRELLQRPSFNAAPEARSQFTFHLIDSKFTPGGGTAYSTELNAPTSILNVAARAMSIDSTNSGDFLQYVDNLKAAGTLEHELGEAAQLRLTTTEKADPAGYYPRVFFGGYVTRRLAYWVDKATQAGIKVVVHNQTLVTDVSKPDAAGVTLHLQEALTDGKPGEDIGTLEATHVFYATGHWQHKDKSPKPYETAPGTIVYPASRETLTARGVFGKPDNIAVMGSSLSAIDAVFAILLNPAVGTLTWDNGVPAYTPKDPKNPFRVTCYSRRGAWPKVRPASAPDLTPEERMYTAAADYEEFRRYINQDKPPTLDQCIELLNLEMARVYGRDAPADPAPGDKKPLPSVVEMTDPIKLIPHPPRDPFALLSDDAFFAEAGDSSSTDKRNWVRWYAVVNGLLPVMKRMYRNLSAADRDRFDLDLNTPFLWAFAPMPLVTAKVLLALRRAGVLELYRAKEEDKAKGTINPGTTPDGKHIVWEYYDHNANLDGKDTALKATHNFMAVVAGLGSDIRKDASDLTINQIANGEFTCVDPKVPGATENTVFLHDDDSYEFVTTAGKHTAARRGVGFFAHGSVWSIQAVPMVVLHSGRAAQIYVDEFEQRLGVAPVPAPKTAKL